MRDLIFATNIERKRMIEHEKERMKDLGALWFAMAVLGGFTFSLLPKSWTRSYLEVAALAFIYTIVQLVRTWRSVHRRKRQSTTTEQS